jgi:dCMP deaminase
VSTSEDLDRTPRSQNETPGEPIQRAGRRPTVDEYFMSLAAATALRSTCPRKRVGAVVVDRDNLVVSAGYNGSLSGAPHCDDIGCLLENGKCVRTVHAEVNAVVHGDRSRMVGGTVYVTALPCWNCFKTVVAAGITSIAFGDLREDPLVERMALISGIALRQVAVQKF